MGFISRVEGTYTVTPLVQDFSGRVFCFVSVRVRVRVFDFRPSCRSSLFFHKAEVAARRRRGKWGPHRSYGAILEGTPLLSYDDDALLLHRSCLLSALSRPLPPRLSRQASVVLQRCPRLTEAAEAGQLLAGLSGAGGAGGEYLALNLEKEVIAELHTPWAVSVKKWRRAPTTLLFGAFCFCNFLFVFRCRHTLLGVRTSDITKTFWLLLLESPRGFSCCRLFFAFRHARQKYRHCVFGLSFHLSALRQERLAPCPITGRVPFSSVCVGRS